LTTTCFPAAEVPLVVPGHVPGLVLDTSALGSPELARDELVRALRPLTVGYRAWLEGQQGRLTDDPEIVRYSPAEDFAPDRARPASSHPRRRPRHHPS